VRADPVRASRIGGAGVMPPVIVFGMTWLLGILAVTVLLTITGRG
jgi:hypothetical protein